MDAVVRVANQLAPRFGTPVVTAADIERMRQQTLREIVAEVGVPMWKLPWILRRVRQELRQEVPTIAPIAGVIEALSELRARELRLGVLTSNSRQNVEAFLRSHQLDELFEIVATEASIFGKQRLLKRCLKQHRLHLERTIYVGDETRDIEAASAVGMRSVGVSWGFNTRERLLTCGPDGVAGEPGELVELLLEIADRGSI